MGFMAAMELLYQLLLELESAMSLDFVEQRTRQTLLRLKSE
jgi:hypothetical protein